MAVWPKAISPSLFSVLTGKPSLQDFSIIPDFLSFKEQWILLSVGLKLLDDGQTRRSRKRMEQYRRNSVQDPLEGAKITDVFFPDSYYEFEEGHFDGVIQHYRERHLSAWPVNVPGLPSILDRLHSLLPSRDIQTHLLHLASNGYILPHIDNKDASGSWIFGVSLGSERILRISNPDESQFDIRLPSGSVYLQRDTTRFLSTHSILTQGQFQGSQVAGGQRLSIMIRDQPKFSPRTS